MDNKVLSEDDLKLIYCKGIKNRCSLQGGKVTRIGAIKRIIVFLMVSLFSPQKEIDNSIVYFINGRSQRKLNLNILNAEKVYRGFGERVLESLRNDTFVLSPISRWKRLSLVCTGIRTYKRRQNSDNICLWIDFLSIYEFIKTVKPTVIISRGHTDEFTTWFGEYAKAYGFSFEVYQHGVIGCADTAIIPEKIFYSKFFAFDHYSADYFKEHYVGNPDCKYTLYDFPASIRFEKINREKNRVYVGIGEQRNENWVNKILGILLSIEKEITIIIMRHPLSNIVYQSQNNVIIENQKKYNNIDFFITENSTLAIDYYRDKNTVKVIYTDPLAKECFSDYNFVFADNIYNLKELIR